MAAISISDVAPDFNLPDTDGKRHSLGEGGESAPATVVYWTCNHCPYALAWHDRLIKVANDFIPQGVRFFAINSNDAKEYPDDSYEAMKERVTIEGGWPHPYLYDEDQGVARKYEAERTPEIFVLDSDLRLRYHGAPDADYEDPVQDAAWLRTALDDILAGREVEVSETEPVGCTIKWK
jgi:peroxiredoxin